ARGIAFRGRPQPRPDAAYFRRHSSGEQTGLGHGGERGAAGDAPPMSEHVECIVAGAGVIGLAVARRLAQEGREVMVLESELGIGTATSSRNSEVVHAGIYYPTGSLKARLCVEGRAQLYEYC